MPERINGLLICENGIVMGLERIDWLQANIIMVYWRSGREYNLQDCPRLKPIKTVC